MACYGMAITSLHDPLIKINIDKIANKIIHPSKEFIDKIEQLRIIRTINPKQYQQLKTTLPYFCCSLFNPAYRKLDNFSSIYAFTLDFDHFTESNLSRIDVFNVLINDPHIRLLFTTPSGDGLKALFVLNEPCKDPGLYTYFYKAFTHQFVNKYHLEKVVDWVTHDVTRATFFSADPNAWLNNQSMPVCMEDFINKEVDIDFSQVKKDFATEAKSNKPATEVIKPTVIDNDTLLNIKLKLNPNYKSKRSIKDIYVPIILEESIPLIESALKQEGIKLDISRSINYGKQLRVTIDMLWAEINIFYGQKGFSVVRTSKTGSSADLTELSYQIVDKILNG